MNENHLELPSDLMPMRESHIEPKYKYTHNNKFFCHNKD